MIKTVDDLQTESNTKNVTMTTFAHVLNGPILYSEHFDLLVSRCGRDYDRREEEQRFEFFRLKMDENNIISEVNKVASFVIPEPETNGMWGRGWSHPLWIKEFAGKLMVADQARNFVFDVIEEDGDSVNMHLIRTLHFTIGDREAYFETLKWIQCPISDRMIVITDTVLIDDSRFEEEGGTNLAFWGITSDFKVSVRRDLLFQ